MDFKFDMHVSRDSRKYFVKGVRPGSRDPYIFGVKC